MNKIELKLELVIMVVFDLHSVRGSLLSLHMHNEDSGYG